MNVFTLNQTFTARYVAVLALCSMILSAFPASFFVAFAAEDLISSTDVTINVATPRHESVSVDASGYESLQVSFSYDAEALDAGDKFVYGWRSAGTDTQIGSVNGKNENTNNPNVTDEIGTVSSVSLPVGAQVADLQLYFEMEGNKADDDAVIITGYKLSGTKVEVIVDNPTDTGENTAGDTTENNAGGGNDTCEGAGFGNYLSTDRIDGDDLASPGSVSVTGGTISWTHDGTYLDWQSTGVVVHAVIVKGGNDSNVWDYDPAAISDTGLHAPNNESGKPAGISNLTFCYEVVPDDPEEVVTIVATKIICNEEGLLPNWGNGAPAITAATAAEFLASTEARTQGCYLAPDWQFQWTNDKVLSKDVDQMAEFLPGWTTSDFTDGTGSVMITIPEEDLSKNPGHISFREAFQEDHIPFTRHGANDGSNVSAEIYCDEDNKFYDNSEWIEGVEAGETYHCVAWNVPETRTCELTLVSDELDFVVEKNDYAQILTTIHNNWVLGIAGSAAKWIWGDNPVVPPTSLDETQTFQKGFTWTGDTITSATLTIASDNSHAIELGSFVDGDAGEFNYGATTPYDVKDYIEPGTNLLEIAVKNFGLANSNPGSNPAGLIYELKIEGTTTGKNCGEVVPVEPEDPEEPVEFCSFDGKVIETTADVDAKKNNNTPVDADRRDVTGVENGPATYQNTAGKEPSWSTDDFFSLGIGGFLTYEFIGEVAYGDGTGAPDIAIYEITGGPTAQVTGEKIEVFVSQNGVSYTSLGVFTGDAYVDIDPAGLDFVKYVKLVDNSQGIQGGNGDGYDVDAIVILTDRCGEEPKTATVTMCKVDQYERPLAGWTLMLRGEQVDTLVVPATNSVGVDTVSLEGGMSYIAIAEGTWDNNRGPLNIVDAEYSTEDNWLTQMDGFTGFPTDILELFIDGVSDPDSQWGTYNSNHRYAQSFVPAVDGAINLHINDTYYPDNTGSLDVEIFSGYAGITNDDGCVVFEEVPYGTYQADEIMLDGWENVSGLGEIVIDEPEETHTVMNEGSVDPVPFCSVTIVSDETNTVVEKAGAFAKLVSWFHPDWTAVVQAPSAWIWGDDPVADPVGATTQTFVNTFEWIGPAATATLTIAADNSYDVTLNSYFGGDAAAKNFLVADTHNLTSLVTPGTNTLEIEVTNLAQVNGTVTTNPAGLKYHLEVLSADPNCIPVDNGDTNGDSSDTGSNDEDPEGNNQDDPIAPAAAFTASGGGGVLTGGGSSDSSSDTEEEREEEDEGEEEEFGSGGDFPIGEVLGEQVSVVPTGAPNAGAGGAARDAAQPFVLLALALVLFVARRVQLN